MHEMYEIRDRLCDELKEISRNGVTTSNLGTIDTLAHAIKNIDKIIECDEGEGYSERSYPDGMGGTYRRSYTRSRDSMGRHSGYSRDGGLADKLHDLMQDAPNDDIKRDLRRIADKL